MTFGLTPLGFNQKRLADIKNDLENAMIAQFGDINIDPQSVFGQEIGVLAKQYADIWENLSEVYYSQYPNSAEGASLDNVVQYNGLTRLAALQTRVIAICGGNESTLIPSGSLAKIPNSNSIFTNPENGIITSTNAYSVKVNVGTLASQVYTTLINNQSFIFSLPRLTLTGSFVSDNVIVVTINGIELTAVPFNMDSSQTNADVAAMIATDPSVLTAVNTDATHINITPNVGFSVTINSIQITGGASQPSYATTFRTPSSVNQVSQYLSAVINAGTQPVTSNDLTGSFEVISTSADTPFLASVQTNLSISERTSPVLFLSQEYGPVPCPANALTEILTPIAGWTSITNPEAGLTGRFIETDSELRIRRAQSIRLAGNATVEAIRARILQEVPGVTNCLVFENITIIQAQITIVFSAALITGNQITIEMNSRVLPTITFATSNTATMGQLASLLSVQPEIFSCTVGGTSDNTLFINMNIFQEVIIDSVTIIGGASQADYVVRGGRPPKSFECVVSGGTDHDVAEMIWLSKPAGIQTYGNVNNGMGIQIIDSMGNTQVIYFSRPIPIYIWVQVTLTLNAEENFPVNGIQLVADSILAYGISLGIGIDVLLQRVLCQIFTVPGVASGVMTLAATNGPNDTPAFSGADIIIDESEISTWDLARITVSV